MRKLGLFLCLLFFAFISYKIISSSKSAGPKSAKVKIAEDDVFDQHGISLTYPARYRSLLYGTLQMG